MGITNDLFPQESAFGDHARSDAVCAIRSRTPKTFAIRGRAGAASTTSRASCASWLRPARGDVNDQVRAGEQVFAAIGCTTCHVPTLETGPSANPLFHRKTVALFSDLLLHDVGTGDGIKQGAAEPNEIRTPALWGLRFRRPLLHDGTATLEEAIRRHAREAELARRGFERLSDVDRAALLAFLGIALGPAKAGHYVEHYGDVNPRPAQLRTTRFGRDHAPRRLRTIGLEHPPLDLVHAGAFHSREPFQVEPLDLLEEVLELVRQRALMRPLLGGRCTSARMSCPCRCTIVNARQRLGIDVSIRTVTRRLSALAIRSHCALNAGERS